MVAIATAVNRTRARRRRRSTVTVALTAAACCAVAPLLQMVLFGHTDYRRHADGDRRARGARVR
jgi:hypothetical protein